MTAAAKRSPLDVLLGAESVEDMLGQHSDDGPGQKRAILAEILTVTILPSPGGGRHEGGTYFNEGAVDIALTERARAKLGESAA